MGSFTSNMGMFEDCGARIPRQRVPLFALQLFLEQRQSAPSHLGCVTLAVCVDRAGVHKVPDDAVGVVCGLTARVV